MIVWDNDFCGTLFGFVSLYDAVFDLKLTAGHSDLYIPGLLILPSILKTLRRMNMIA